MDERRTRKVRTVSEEFEISYDSMDDFVELFKELASKVPSNAKWELTNFTHEGGTSMATLKFWWAKDNDWPKVPDATEFREQVATLCANFDSLHPDTEFWVYREFKPLSDSIEYTVYYREPERTKMRVDLSLEVQSLETTTFENLEPKHFRITYWGEARNAIK